MERLAGTIKIEGDEYEDFKTFLSRADSLWEHSGMPKNTSTSFVRFSPKREENW
jgi:hypothetical protein